jgi:hypothetical protein
MYVAEESDAVSVDDEAGPHDVDNTRITMAMAGRRKRFITGIIVESLRHVIDMIKSRHA